MAVHGPEVCERPCFDCDPGHHWIAEGLDPETEEEDDAHGVMAYDRENGTDHALGHYVCKHCPAWCEVDDVEDE